MATRANSSKRAREEAELGEADWQRTAEERGAQIQRLMREKTSLQEEVNKMVEVCGVTANEATEARNMVARLQLTVQSSSRENEGFRRALVSSRAGAAQVVEQAREAQEAYRTQVNSLREKNLDLLAILATAQRQTRFLGESLEQLQADGHLSFP